MESSVRLEGVDEGEVGAGVEGFGGGELPAEPGDGAGPARCRRRGEPHVELVADDFEIGRGAECFP